jgi:hypothetical protein
MVKHGVRNSAFCRRKKAAAAEHGFAQPNEPPSDTYGGTKAKPPGTLPRRRFCCSCDKPHVHVFICQILFATRQRRPNFNLLISSARRMSRRDLAAGQRGRRADKRQYKATSGSRRFMAAGTDRLRLSISISVEQLLVERVAASTLTDKRIGAASSTSIGAFEKLQGLTP